MPPGQRGELDAAEAGAAEAEELVAGGALLDAGEAGAAVEGGGDELVAGAVGVSLVLIVGRRLHGGELAGVEGPPVLPGQTPAVLGADDRALLSKLAEGTFLGPDHARELLAFCDRLPSGEVPRGFRDPVSSDVPVLLLSGELDPVTPPRWADDAARTLSRSQSSWLKG